MAFRLFAVNVLRAIILVNVFMTQLRWGEMIKFFSYPSLDFPLSENVFPSRLPRRIKVNENQCFALGMSFHFTVSSALFVLLMVEKLPKRQNNDDIEHEYKKMDLRIMKICCESF